MHDPITFDTPTRLRVPTAVIDRALGRRVTARRRWRPFAVVAGAHVEAVEVVTPDRGDYEVDDMLADDAVDERTGWLQD